MIIDYDTPYYESSERRARRIRNRRVKRLIVAGVGIGAFACCSGIVLNFIHVGNLFLAAR